MCANVIRQLSLIWDLRLGGRSPESFAISNSTVRMTVPRYVLSCIGIVSGAWLAARAGRRAPFIISSAVVVIVGITRWLLEYEFFSGFNRLPGDIILLVTKTRTLSL